METQKELSIAEKKKEVLGKINEVIESFKKLKLELLEINIISEKLKLVKFEEDRKKIISEANEKLLHLLKSIDDLKKNNAHRTNEEIHVAHNKISNNIETIVEGIIKETKLKTIITISLKLPELIKNLGKNLKTGIGVEILAESFDKFEKIKTPLDLEKIRSRVEIQIENIEHRINEAQNICKVIKYLDVGESSPILNDLIDYILGGKNYDEIDERLKDQGIFIQEITLKPLEYFSGENKVDKTPILNNTKNNENVITISQEQNNPSLGFKTFFKTLFEWLNTDKSVNWSQAKENILKRAN